MSFEIIYTSAPLGLSGASGYTTVAASDGIPENIRKHLERLTGYEHLASTKAGQSSKSPVAFVHYTSKVGGKGLHILGRIGNVEKEHTGRRGNLIAHLIAVSDREMQVIDNTAEVLLGIPWKSSWPPDQKPKLLNESEQVAIAQRASKGPGRCKKWEEMTGHPGWGGVLAESILNSKHRRAALIVPRDHLIPDTYLELLSESLYLLPPSKRNAVNFSTYFTDNLPRSIDCHWQFVVDETQLANQVRRDPRTLVIELGRDLGIPQGGEFVEVASNGGYLSWQQGTDANHPTNSSATSNPGEQDVGDEGSQESPDDDYGMHLPSGARKLPRRRKRKQTPRKKSRFIIYATGFVAIVACVALVFLIMQSKEGSPAQVANRDDTPNRTAPLREGQLPAQTLSVPHSEPSLTTTPLAPLPESQATPAPPQQIASLTPAPTPPKENTAGQEPAKTSETGNSAKIKSVRSKPFDEIRAKNKVLHLPTSQHLPTLPSKPSVLTTLQTEKLDLEIVGSEDVLRNAMFRIRKEGHDFQVFRQNVNSINPRSGDSVGKFKLEDGYLTFTWDTNNTSQAEQFRTCLLRLKSLEPTDELVCSLREPQTIQPSVVKSINVSKTRQELYKIPDTFDDEVTLVAEFAWEVGETEAAVKVNADRIKRVQPHKKMIDWSDRKSLSQLTMDDQNVISKREPRDACARVRVGISQNENVIYAIMSTEVQDQEVNYNNTGIDAKWDKYVSLDSDQYRRNIVSKGEQLKSEIESTKQKLQNVRSSKEEDKDKNIRELDKKLTTLGELKAFNDQRARRIKQIAESFNNTADHIKLHVRIYRTYASTSEELILVETEGFPTSK